MTNIIQFNKNGKSNKTTKHNIRFVVRASNIDISNPNARKPAYKKHAVICLRNDDLDRETVHPLTDFIFNHWKNSEYNSMAVACNKIVPFLNWVYFERKEKVNDLSELTIDMFREFLELQIYKGSQKATVNKYANVIHKFYIYLYNNEILISIDASEFLPHLATLEVGASFFYPACNNRSCQVVYSNGGTQKPPLTILSPKGFVGFLLPIDRL